MTNSRAMVTAFGCLIAIVLAVWLGTASSHEATATSKRVPPGIAPRKVVTCADAVLLNPSPSRGFRVLFDRVALPPKRLQRPSAAPQNHPLHYFAKQGLEVRAGRGPVELIVPTAWRDRLALGFGETGGPQQASVIKVLGCQAHKAWYVYPGGYFLLRPACVPLVIRTAGQTARLEIGIGMPCS